MKDLKRRETLAVRYQKFINRKSISEKEASPYTIKVNGDEHFPIFVDIRENLLITGQTLSAAPGYGIDLTEQLLRKNHIIHAQTTYEGVEAIWFNLHSYGFVTDTTAARHIARNHRKDSPRFAFHVFHDTHHLVEDTTNGGKVLGHYNIDSQTPMDVILYLKRDTGPVVEQVLSGDATLSEKLETLRDLPGSLITKLMHKGSLANSEIPPLASLSMGYNHIILGNVPSETAFEYKNRLHLRDVSAACEIYFKDRWLEFGWNLQLRPMGNWVIVTPDNEPVLQRTSSTRSKLGYNWNARNGR